MQITVCITTFNEEKSIAKLLDSLLDQTLKPTDIIIVDGGSTDKRKIVGLNSWLKNAQDLADETWE